MNQNQNQRPYKIAIPSYRRKDILKTQTLKVLEEYEIPKECITIFLYDEKDYNEYSELLPDYNFIKSDIEDLAQRLNYITDYYNEGDYVIIMEDDIQMIKMLFGNVCGKIVDLHNHFIDAYETLTNPQIKGYLWGISPTDNSYFMKPQTSEDFKFCIGVMFGYIVRKLKELNVSISYRQDFERSIIYWIKDKGIVRYNNICVKTKYRNKSGLGNGIGREVKEMEASKQLIEKYPEYVRFNKRRGGTEVQLIKNKKRDLQKN